jgi:hypothetical protein
MACGRKVELITQDTAGNAALAKTKTQELVERYKVPDDVRLTRGPIGPVRLDEYGRFPV